jgi:hypothetical protein
MCIAADPLQRSLLESAAAPKPDPGCGKWKLERADLPSSKFTDRCTKHAES